MVFCLREAGHLHWRVLQYSGVAVTLESPQCPPIHLCGLKTTVVKLNSITTSRFQGPRLVMRKERLKTTANVGKHKLQ